MDLELLRKCSDCGDPMTERSQDSIPGIRQFQARGMCTLCYQVALKSGVIGARARVEYTDTEIKCMKCGLWKSKSAFKEHKSTRLGYEYSCRMCSKLYERYGITYIQYIRLFEVQNYMCAICGKPLEPLTREAHVDHDHNCCANSAESCGNCVRGILCNTCNAGLGMFKDDPAALREAANYIENRGNPMSEESSNLFAVPASEASDAGRALNDPKSTPSELSKAGETLNRVKDEGIIHDKLFGA